MAVLIIEDDAFYSIQLAEILRDSGVEFLVSHTAEDALNVQPTEFDAAVIDVMLPNNPSASGISAEEARGGFLTGIALARRFRESRPNLKIVLITGDLWGSTSGDWAKSQGIPIVLKSDGQKEVRAALSRLGVLKELVGPRAFVVHGHDEVALLQLKNYLQNVLHWPEPVILREQPNYGRTLIEKFEELAGRIDCVFVLLTPDDAIVSKQSPEPRRSRQNVIFELGFFFGQIGRESGRVIVLYKGPTELPTDIHGIAWIGIDKGVEAASEEIRREVASLMPNQVQK
jgi:predicted nucleotide-binding protein/CheY-like chemotaxis protein